MIQRSIRRSYIAARQKGGAVLLAFWLNLALLPCAMAMEEPNPQHDCCPPSIELQAPDCCELDAVTVDHREDIDPGAAVFGPMEHRALSAAARAAEFRAVRPPDPGTASAPIYVLNCVYLK